MESPLTEAVTAQPSSQQTPLPIAQSQTQPPLPQSQPFQQQPPLAGAPAGSFNPGAIKVFAILLLVVVALGYVLSYFWNIFYTSSFFNSLDMPLAVIVRIFAGAWSPLLLILTGFAGMAFSRKMRMYGIADKWLSGCALADIIAGFTLLASRAASAVSAAMSNSVYMQPIQPGTGITEALATASAIGNIALIVGAVGVLATVIILFVKSGAARQVIHKSDLLGIVSAVCLALSMLLQLANTWVILPSLISMTFNPSGPTATGLADTSWIGIMLSIIAGIIGLLLSAFFILRAIFWLTNTKKVVSQLGPF